MSDTSASLGSRPVNAFGTEAGNGLFARTECFIGERGEPVQPEKGKNGQARLRVPVHWLSVERGSEAGEEAGAAFLSDEFL